MKDNGFWEGKKTKAVRVGDILAEKKGLPPIIAVSPKDTLDKAIALMNDHSISQLPVMRGNDVLGSLNEASLMRLLHDGAKFEETEISSVMGKPLPTLDWEVEISEAYRVLLSGTSGIVVKRQGTPAGLLTRADFVNHWTRHGKEVDYEI